MAAEPEENPYVGPRPFGPTDADRARFFGRDREVEEIVSLVVSHAAVLIYAQSGAGKTSLFNTAVAAALERKRVVVMPLTRVRAALEPGLGAEQIGNLYVYSALLNLDAADPSTTLAEYLRTQVGDEPSPRVIVFDQFEEIFTFEKVFELYPETWQQQQEGFFRQVAEAITADPLLRVVFMMRKEHVAEMDRFAHLLPERLQTRFHLQPLDERKALAAVSEPINLTHRRFQDGVPEGLVAKLLRSRVDTGGDEPVDVKGQWVEPVHLQVVCQSLWSELPQDVVEITDAHLKTFGNVDEVLGRFYDSAVRSAAIASRTDEGALRRDIEALLITTAGTRGAVLWETDSKARIPSDAITELEHQRLVRADWRAGARWYELTHDRLIAPIQSSNSRYRSALAAKRRRRLRVAATLAIPVLLAAILVPVVLWRVEEDRADAAEREAMVLSGHDDIIATAVFSPDGERILTASYDDTARLWNFVEKGSDCTKAEQRTLAAKCANRTSTIRILRGHSEDVRTAVFSPDGTLALTASDDRTARVWAVPSGKLLHVLKGHTDVVNTAAFDRSGARVVTASSDKSARVWDANTGKLITTLRHGVTVATANFSPDGQVIATGSTDGYARLWRTATGEEIAVLRGHSDIIETVDFSRDGRWLLTTSDDETARLWSTSSRKTVAVLRGHNDIVYWGSFSPDGKMVATASYDYTARLWEVPSGRLIRTLRHSDAVASAAFSPDGKQVVTASLDSMAPRVWTPFGR